MGVNLILDPREFRITFVRSAGPGGQNVNKLSTRAVIRFSLRDSTTLTDAQRTLIHRRLSTRITRSGDIRVSCQRHRTQSANRAEALRRLTDLLTEAATPPKPRRKTRPTAAAKRRRLDDKKRRAVLKQSRRSPNAHRE